MFLASPFRRPLFLAFWSAYLLSAVGTQVQIVGAAWLMTSISESAATVAFITTASSLPMLLFAMVSGVICDIFDRRLVLLFAQFIMLGSSSVLTIATLASLTSPALLIICTFIIGCGFALNAPAWQTIVRELVPQAELRQAINANSLAFNVGRMGGPALGGVIVAALGSGIAFLTNSISYLALICLLFLWKREKSDNVSTPRETLRGAFASGFRYSWYTPIIRKIVLRDFIYGLAGAAVIALVPLVARDRLDTGPIGYGLLVTFLGAGSIFGALITGPMQKWLGAGRWVVLAMLGQVIATATIALSGHSLPIYAGHFFVGAGTVSILTTFNAVLQLSVPNWVVGRTVALHQTALFGGLALGSALWGGVVTMFDLGAPFLASAAILALLAVFSLRMGLRFDVDDANKPAVPSIQLSIPDELADRKVRVEIKYQIPEESESKFIAAMEQKKIIRRRLGIRDWKIVRVEGVQNQWLESYSSPNWAEHMRFWSRRTQADAELQSCIIALHEGNTTPPLHYIVGQTYQANFIGSKVLGNVPTKTSSLKLTPFISQPIERKHL